MGILVNKYFETDQTEMYVREYSKLVSTVEPINFLSKGSDEIFVGRAGYLW